MIPSPLFDALTVTATVGLTASLLAVAWIDLRSFRIPDAISLPLIVAGLALAALTPGLPDHLIGAGVGFAVLAAIGEVYFRRTGEEGLGLGDAKLFAAAGAWLGWQALPQVLLIAAGAGLIFALMKGNKGQRIAFGPWLALGFWGVWMAKLAGMPHPI